MHAEEPLRLGRWQLQLHQRRNTCTCLQDEARREEYEREKAATEFIAHNTCLSHLAGSTGYNRQAWRCKRVEVP